MDDMNRRKFLKVVGVGSGAVAAGAALPAIGMGSWSGARAFSFRAVGGLPGGPVPAYASFVLEGHVDVARRSGVVTKNVFAGGPDEMSSVALPGLSRAVRVTDVRDRGGRVYVDGVIDDATQLRPGESREVRIQIDRDAGVARARFLGSDVLLRLQA